MLARLLGDAAVGLVHQLPWTEHGAHTGTVLERLFFGGTRKVQRKDPDRAQALATEPPIVGRVHSQSLPANLQPGKARNASIMVSDHV